MSDRVTLRQVRPYGTEDDLVEAEAWTIDKRGMYLIGQPRMESGTVLRFELLLSSGKRLLVAEGKVVGYAEDSDARPAGLKVRFKRFNAASKAFIDRVLAARAAAAAAVEEPAPPPPGPAQPPPRAVDPERSGIRHRAKGPVHTPGNRDELLDKLRERARAAKAKSA